MGRPSRNILSTLLIDVLILSFGMVGVHRATQRVSVPATFKQTGNWIVVGKMLPAAGPVGLHPGDTVVSVNGHPVSQKKDIEFILDGLRIQNGAAFTIRRDGKFQTIPLHLVSFYGRFYFFTQILVGPLFFFLGLFAFMRRPEDEAASVFHWVSVCVALMVMATSNRYPSDPLGISRALDFLYSTASVFAPLLLVHFTFVFPRPKWPRAKRALAALYAAAVALSIWESIALFLSSYPVSMDWFHRFVTAYAVTRTFFIACILFFLASLVHSYRTAAEESERRKLRWVMLGLNLGPPTFIAWQIPILIGSQSLVREEYMHLALALVPITFAISIIRYRLMDIDLIFRRSTVYAAVLVVILSFYALVVGLAARLVGTFTVKWSLIASTSAAIVVALLFEPLRRVAQRSVDRAFFRVQYNYSEAERQFVDAITRTLNARELAELIVREIGRFIPVERMGLFTFEPPGSRLHLLAHQNLDLLQTGGIHLDVEQLKAVSRFPMSLEDNLESGVPFQRGNAELFQRWRIAVVFPIMTREAGDLGFLVLGPKKSGTRFSVEDIDLLTTMATQAGLAIERIALQERLLLEQAEARRLEELNRITSYFVSSVSHELKTPLTSVKMFAEMLRTRSDLPIEEQHEYLEIIEGETDRLARLIKNVLDFSKVEQGVKEYHFSALELNELVKQVLRSFTYQFKQEECRLLTKLSPTALTVQADADAVIEALENLLSNALKYSRKEKQIAVSTFSQDHFAAVRVADHGMGISSEDLPHIFDPFYRGKSEKSGGIGGAGLGLTLVKHIMEEHGGRIEVQSAPREGSQFTLFFPQEGHR